MFELLVYVEILLMYICVLINVAFITLMERKILGYSQSRVGPSKPSFWGLLQPMSDAVKLFVKQMYVGVNSHKYMFFLSPSMSLFLMLSLWGAMGAYSPSASLEMSCVVVLMFLGVNVYPILVMGWSSSSKYSLIGSLRGVSQSISYEISMAFFLMVIIQISFSLSFVGMGEVGVTMFSLFPLVLLFWLLVVLAESNRTPFDFAEGESELVSGFNIEYSSGGFALVFMGEYGMIYFLSLMSVMMFMVSESLKIFSLFSALVVFMWIWVRGTFPRYRYDMLMNLAWKCMLPVSISYLLFSLVLVLYIKI